MSSKCNIKISINNMTYSKCNKIINVINSMVFSKIRLKVIKKNDSIILSFDNVINIQNMIESVDKVLERIQMKM